jgi:hypothetical protein
MTHISSFYTYATLAIMYHQCHVHSGIANTMLGTVITSRINLVNELFDNMTRRNVKHSLIAIRYHARSTRKDLVNYLKFEGAWNNTNRINIMCTDILVYIRLLERSARNGDIIGCKSCATEIITLIYRKAIQTPPCWLSW